MNDAMPTCFVIMGFGTRTDLKTGRALNLDATYESLIKPAVEEAGLQYIRADEISGSGTIDLQMFENLLDAEVVVADVSTSNNNALYELGVRHALRPYATIIIAEQTMKDQQLPFDISHVTVHFYKHLGEDIGVREVSRFKPLLTKACKRAIESHRVDSPVYTFLHSLQAPKKIIGEQQDTRKSEAKNQSDAIAPLMEQFRQAREAGQYSEARLILTTVRKLRGDDPYILQQLAYVTYMDRSAAPSKALKRAREILQILQPERTNDPQTLGLWGAVHKRLFEMSEDEGNKRQYMDVSIQAFERGFALRNDHYNGINLAYMLHVRSNYSPPAEAIADFVRSQRVRKEVVSLCELLLNDTDRPSDDLAWIHASLAEALLGLGEDERSSEALERAKGLLPNEDDWRNLVKKLDDVETLLSACPLRFIAGQVDETSNRVMK
jgi:tetratricopeptide (TPR) repeat protein